MRTKRWWVPVLTAAVAAIALAAPSASLGVAQIPDHVTLALPDFDSRSGARAVRPDAEAVSAVDRLDAAVTWNRFGTPHSLIRYDRPLAAGLPGADAVEAARGWIGSNNELFGLSAESVANLEVLNDSPIGAAGHAVLFRQRFGTAISAPDGLITVGIRRDAANSWSVVYVSSSAVGDRAAPGAPTLTPQAAWVAAAANAGKTAALPSISASRTEHDWTVFDVPGFSEQQRARLRAFPTLTGVRPAYETNVVDNTNARPTAYTVFVDAQTGEVLWRESRVDNLANEPLRTLAPRTFPFQGTYTDNPEPKRCGPISGTPPVSDWHGPYAADAATKSIDVVAAAAVETNDIILELHFGATKANLPNEVAHSDTATSPEVIHYTGTGGIVPAGNYWVRVCPYGAPIVPPMPPYNYAGNITINDVVGASFAYPPKWKWFRSNPSLAILSQPTGPGSTDYDNTDVRFLGCWESTLNAAPNPPTPVPGCQYEFANLASRAPWDHDVRQNAPTFTTRGNNAVTGEAWGSPLTPAEPYRPVSLTREYSFPWTDQWNNTKCSNATVFTSPQRNDIDAATTNLFVQHNRMHDWSYFLGFTERNFNLQENNFGLTPPGPFPGGRENDPEVGNAQAGGISGAPPGYGAGFGRDNANQVTLQDGVPGITNMYLWQPLNAGFYPPCVDGDYDMSVIGHEYTHAISNRMVGGPDSNLSGPQAGAMGESWSDLAAVEYQQEFGFEMGAANEFAVGPYATGSLDRGIRNYAMNQSPLNYSDIGYDVQAGGPQVHADGEIWSATNFDLRQLLVDKYNATHPASNAALQARCGRGELAADQCPGNRRWIQIVFDAWLLMPSAVSMVDARNAYLAADQLRFGGANQLELWRAFARRGLGRCDVDAAACSADPNERRQAMSNTNADPNPIPNFESPLEAEAVVTFFATALDEGNGPVKATVFVGPYETGITPIADTDGETPLTSVGRFVPGTYTFTVRAPGYGIMRQAVTLAAGATTMAFPMSTNWASTAKGGAATGDGVRHAKLLDDTELNPPPPVPTTDPPTPPGYWEASGGPVAGRQVTVALGGGQRTVTRVQVSANVSGRFNALRKFEVYACNTTAPLSPGNATCLATLFPAGFVKLDTRLAPTGAVVDAVFPAVAPRPLVPELNLRTWFVNSTPATHVMLRVLTNQCSDPNTAYQGNQDADPLSLEDCETGNSGGGALTNGAVTATVVRAAEFQVFSTTSNPTHVTITGFAAARSSGRVALTWRTASETGLAGFNVWRIDRGTSTKVNRSLVPAKAGGARGAAYRILDAKARPGRAYTYRLQLVDRNGKRTWAAVAKARVAR